jgi:hypothetical protein
MTMFNGPHWLGLAKAITRGDLEDLAICTNCFGIVPAEGEPGIPSPCLHCGHFDANEWEWVDG